MRLASRRLLPWCALVLLLAGCGDGSTGGEAVGAGEGASWTDTLLAVNGTELFVSRQGSGEPILVIHGGPLLDHGYLKPHLAELADDFQLVYFDQRLSGRSAGTVDSASVRLDTLIADIEGLRRTLGFEEVRILAHSWGGLLALGYAARWPERVSSMLLVSPMAGSAELWRAEEAALAGSIDAEHQAEAQRLRDEPGVARGEPAALAALLRHGFRVQMAEPERVEELQLYVPGDYLARSAQFSRLMGDLQDYDLHAELAEVQAPTRILFGELEPGAELGGAALTRALPDASLVRIADTGHFAFLESPEAFLMEARAALADR